MPRINCPICNKIVSNSRSKFCSNKCQKEYLYRAFINDWIDGRVSGNREYGSVSGFVRRYLFRKNDNKCQECGWGEVNPYNGKVPLAIHHKDGKCMNTTPINVELLCPNCHSLTGTHGALNKGKSERVYRKKQDKMDEG